MSILFPRPTVICTEKTGTAESYTGRKSLNKKPLVRCQKNLNNKI